MRPRSLVIALALALAAAACGGGDGDDGASGAPQARPSSTATVKIVEPAPGAVVPAGRVTITVDLQGGTIVPITTKDLKPGEGHLHISLDGTLISQTEGLEQEIEGVTPGTHVLQAEFVASDHAPFNPRVLTSTTFTAE